MRVRSAPSVHFVFALIFGLLICAQDAFATFVAPEDIRVPPTSRAPANISEAEFRSTIASLQRAYAPLASALGGNLSISGDWKDDRPNAFAKQTFSSWQVALTGGLARRPELTLDGLLLIACHEVGHHFAGFPIAAAPLPFVSAWAAVEGQSDYFSAQVCAKKMFAGEAEKNAEFRERVSPIAKAGCDAAYAGQAERDVCYRTVAAAESTIATMAALMQKPMPSLETPDATVVSKTIEGHPAPQCRFDTLFQGSICPAAFDETRIPGKSAPGGAGSIEAEQEAARVSCTRSTGYSFGLRPLCWFKARL